MDARIVTLEEQLGSPDLAERQSALYEIADLLARGTLVAAPERGIANMQCRTFFSRDGSGRSPTALAWLARKHGYAALGIVDEVLAGVDEFLNACEVLGVRGSAGIEAPVVLPGPEAQEAIRHLGIGFATGRPPAGAAGLLAPQREPGMGIDEFHRFVAACGALPCAAWPEATGDRASSATDADDVALLEVLAAQGVAAVGIVPDRGTRLAPGPDRDREIRHLYAVVRAAADLDLPVVVGSTVHGPGDPLAEDFSTPVLAPLNRAFMAGAYFIYGHTVMQRALARGYGSQWAQEHLQARGVRNDFYETIGRRVRPGVEGMDRLRRLLDLSTPASMLAQLR